jgi:hypothetical protein
MAPSLPDRIGGQVPFLLQFRYGTRRIDHYGR